MGSKNLKAVAVRGTRGVKVAEPGAFRDYVLNLKQRMMQNPIYDTFSTYGTKSVYEGRHLTGGLTMKGGQESGGFWGFDNIKAETLREKYVLKDKACFGCLNHCRDWFEIREGAYAGLQGVGIELSTQEAWGSLLDNDYAPSLYKAFVLCNQYGIDSVESGQLLAAATEWYQMGLITKEDTQGIELDWGNYEAMLEMIPKIANREGIGDLLAEDAVRAAKVLGGGADKCITHSKGACRTNADLRSSVTYAFGHAVSTRGADHLRGSVPVNKPNVYTGVAQQVFENNYVCTLADALEICKFSTAYMGMPLAVSELAELFTLATGMQTSANMMKEKADRIWTLERALIVKEGITRKDDVLVGRFMNEPVHGGSLNGLALDRKKWEKLLDEYYELVGWDKETGAPTRAKLEALGLGRVADDLERLGKL
jgi:aldehyde:ferredoxin oxidoreductase